MRRLLLALAGASAGATVADPVLVVRNIVEGVTTADAHGYELLDDHGSQMGVLKVIDDPAGGYLGVYHVYTGSGSLFDIYLATSTDLATWIRGVKLKASGALPYIGKRADGSFIVGWANQSVSPWQVQLRRYTTRANLIAGTSADDVTLPITLATAGGEEGTPFFASIEDPMDIGFYYHNGSTNRDHNGRGTLTGWSGSSYTSWVTGTAVYDAPVLALDSYVTTAGCEVVTYRSRTLTFVGSQIASGRFYLNYWDGSSAVVQAVTTTAGSGDLDAFRASQVVHPTLAGRTALYCCMYIHDDRGAAGPPEAPGEAWWYKALPV